MITIYIDADACPVKDEAIKVAIRHSLPVYMVSNAYLRNVSGPRVQCIVVSEGADEADDWIVEHIKEGDIFVTADILLAERCIKKIAPTSFKISRKSFNITFARNLK